MITAIILLSVILIASCYINYNLLRKTERLQDFSDNLSRWVDSLNQAASNIVSQLDVIDEKGMFKSDDYVGSIYKDINALIRELDKIIIRDEQENVDD